MICEGHGRSWPSLTPSQPPAQRVFRVTFCDVGAGGWADGVLSPVAVQVSVIPTTRCSPGETLWRGVSSTRRDLPMLLGM